MLKFLKAASIFTVLLLTAGCGRNKQKELEVETQKILDSLRRVNHLYTETGFTDSTRVYGTGDFNYQDTLDSFHKGYSIPRDSIYKVWNTKAFKELDEYIKTHPLEPAPYLDRGNHWQNIKMYPEAIADYNKYIELNPYNPSAWMNRGNAHERLHHYDSALFDYNKVLELKPNDTIANFNKGNVYDFLGKYDSALVQYDTVIMKDPRLAKAYYNRGTTHLALKHYDKAVIDWEIAIRLNPVYEMDLRPRIDRIKRLLK